MNNSIEKLTSAIQDKMPAVLQNCQEYLLVQTNSSVSALQSIRTIIQSNEEYSRVQIHESSFTQTVWQRPYGPLMSIISSLLSQKSESEIVKIREKYIYPLHVYLFHYLKHKNVLQRHEPVYRDELEFEQKNITSMFVDLITVLCSDTPVVLVLSSVLHAPGPLVEVLKKLNELKNKTGLFVICLINNSGFDFDSKSGYFRPAENRLQIDKRITVTYENPAVKKHIACTPSIAEKIDIIQESFHFLALGECTKQSLQLYQEMEGNYSSLTIDEQMNLYRTLGFIHFYRQDYQSARNYLQILNNISQKQRAYAHQSTASRLLGTILMIQGNARQAFYYSREAKKTAELQDDPALTALAEILQFRLIRLESKADTDYLPVLNTKIDSIKTLLLQQGMKNSLAYLLSYEVVLMILLKEHKQAQKVLNLIKESIHYAREIKNFLRIAMATNAKGIIQQALGMRKSAEKSYLQSIRYADRIKNHFLHARFCNGIGYFYFSSGQFSKAEEYYNNANIYLKSSRYFDDLCSNLFNFGCLNFFSFNNQEAHFYFSSVLAVMDSLAILNLRFHSREALYSLCGLTSLLTGEIKSAYQYLNLVEDIIKMENYYLSLEYTYLFKAEIAKYEGRLHDAKKLMVRGYKIMKSKKVDENYLVIRYLYELGLLYKTLGQQEKFLRSMEKAKTICGKYSFETMIQRIDDKTAGSKIPVSERTYGPENFDFALYIEFVRQEYIINRLEEKVEEISYLKNLQALLSSEFKGFAKTPYENKMLYIMYQALLEEKSGNFSNAEKLYIKLYDFISENDELESKFTGMYYYCMTLFYRAAGNSVNETRYHEQAVMQALKSGNQVFYDFLNGSKESDFDRNTKLLFQNKLYILRSLVLYEKGESEFLVNNFMPEDEFYIDLLGAFVTSVLRIRRLIIEVLSQADTVFQMDTIALIIKNRDNTYYKEFLSHSSLLSDNPYDRLTSLYEILSDFQSEHIFTREELSALQLPIPFFSLVMLSIKNEPERHYMLLAGNILHEDIIQKQDVPILSLALRQIITTLDKLYQDKQIIEKNICLEQEVKNRTQDLMISLEKNKKQSDEIRQYNQQLEKVVEERTHELVKSEKMASLGGLVSGLAHEVNTPIGVVITSSSYIETLINRMSEDYTNKRLTSEQFRKFLIKANEALNLVNVSAARVKDLVQSFKKLSIDQTKIEKSRFNLLEYIHNNLQIVSPQIKKKQVEVTIDCPKNLFVQSYPGLYSQIFTNLFINALNHAFADKSGGTIHLSVAEDEDKLIITFSDNGSGMDEETMKKIYEPFFTTARSKGGTGLGLHIIYNIVTHNLHGTIDCSSEAGKGTTFTITVPRIS